MDPVFQKITKNRRRSFFPFSFLGKDKGDNIVSCNVHFSDFIVTDHMESGSWKLLISWKSYCFLRAGEHCSTHFCIEILSVCAKTNLLQNILHTEMPIRVVESSQFGMNEMYTCTSNQNHKFLNMKKVMFSIENLWTMGAIWLVNLS